MPWRDVGSGVWQRASVRYWTGVAQRAVTADLGALRRQRARARGLRAQLDRVLAIADERLALPRIGSTIFPQPAGTDWAWRPPLWREALPRRGAAGAGSPTPLGVGAALFHDCGRSEIVVRQVRNRHERDLAAFGVRLDVFRFDGTYLSLVLELPAAAAAGLTRRHLLRLEAIVETERPAKLFVRLNVKHGPNVEQVVRELPGEGPAAMVEFDLAYTDLDERRVERIWLDLIFDAPEMNRVTLRDVTLARYNRADL